MKTQFFIPGLLLSLALASPLTSAPAQTVTKESLLRKIVSEVIVPGYKELAVKCAALTNSVEALAKAPTEESLSKARQAWLEAMLASRQIQWLQNGPIADREYLATFYYWKIFPSRIDGVFTATHPIDAGFLDQVAATTKGMFALEYLLFKMPSGGSAQPESSSSAILASFTGPESVRRKEYVKVIARDLEAKSSQLLQDWTATGDQSAAGKLAKDGQQGLNLLINQFAQFVEQVTEQRLHFVLVLPAPVSNQLDRLETSRSGMSQKVLVAVLKGVQKLYQSADGLGLDGYVKQLNAGLAERLKRQFDATIAACEAIGAPLENVVPNNRPVIERAYEQSHTLEVLCKTELASTLGVTLTFSGADND